MKNNPLTIIILGFFLGIVSSFLGIGGGFLLVPILIYLFHYSPHEAAATSIFSLCLYSAVGAVLQMVYGNIDWTALLWGGVGVIIGAQIGVRLSSKVSGAIILRMLALLLMVVGAQMLFFS
ncbi:sulfite exporter TauE/SafE family protein [Bacillus sp. FJAT-42315]|uniref:sulfite exporter TauE/SafE family protein n=1 Tax=Bacillus sp. FJAT-42315 TaxID=2014077 RepID=UPI0022B7F65A|nr:sulfite exporter TauE/SafE family protein [Bacillus sp. FJAT-42315]